MDEACKGLAHGGGIFARMNLGAGVNNYYSFAIYLVSWSPDSKRIVTASGDKTVKIWNAINQTLLK